MARSSLTARLLTFCILLCAFSGCSSVSIDSKQFLGGPEFAPTIPSTVQILRSEPTAPFVRLGELTVEPFGEPTVPEIELKMREAAAKLGGNAVVIVMDRTMRMGATVSGPMWARSVDPNFERVIIGVVIRYTL